MNFQETLDYIYGFINYDVNRQQRYQPDKFALDRPRALMRQLGDPHKAYPVVHITGTKGKGSVGAMCASVLQESGLRVGLYSSPHLQDFRERFRINGQFISETDLITLVEDIKPVIESIPNLGWFEVITALAFEYFRRSAVDFAVVEVGLGGRLDTTNIVTPLVSVITSLSLDHMALLGDTLPEIAYEKAGIIKPGIPVVSAPQQPAALAVLEQVAAERNASLILVGRDWKMEPLTSDLSVERWRAAPSGQPPQNYQTVLIGRHQAVNATVMLAAVEQLRAAGISIPQAAVMRGLMQVNWAGRLEIVSKSPLVVLDAAHNAESAKCLKQTLVERFEWRPLVMVFAAKADKDIEGMLAALLPITDHLVVTQAVDSRAESPENIAELARKQGYTRPIDIVPGVPLALSYAEELAQVDGMVCVTGSLYLVGEARTVYNLEVGQVVSLKNIQQGLPR